MKRIQFDARYRKEIESGKYRVETKTREQVRIVCWDANSYFPIVGIVNGKAMNFSFYGNSPSSDVKLVIVTDETSLTEFEKDVQIWIENFCGNDQPIGDEEYIKQCAAKLKEIVAKEILKEGDNTLYKQANSDGVSIGWVQCADALPHWKKVDADPMETTTCVFDGKLVVKYRGYVLPFEELFDKLIKDEETMEDDYFEELLNEE